MYVYIYIYIYVCILYRYIYIYISNGCPFYLYCSWRISRYSQHQWGGHLDLVATMQLRRPATAGSMSWSEDTKRKDLRALETFKHVTNPYNSNVHVTNQQTKLNQLDTLLSFYAQIDAKCYLVMLNRRHGPPLCITRTNLQRTLSTWVSICVGCLMESLLLKMQLHPTAYYYISILNQLILQ